MATRISFSTHYPDRMGGKAGKKTYFPEKILAGMGHHDIWGKYSLYQFESNLNGYYNLQHGVVHGEDYKTTTIRKNYDYWKSKEGKMIQPFIWAGKPRRSKHIVFCPPVLLKKVEFIRVLYMEGLNVYTGDQKGDEMPFFIDDEITGGKYGVNDMALLSQSEGFDSTEDFFRWFDQDFDGALLKFGEE